jgi:hypothetical protein
MRYPTAVTWNGQLWVFYWDVTRGALRAKTSSDGSTWTLTGANAGFVDGYGGSNHQVWNDVGAYPTAIVDTSDNRLYVFYLDTTLNNLRFSYLDSGSSTWVAGVVQSGVNMDTPAAATVSGCIGCLGVQVWYVNTETHTLQGATRTGDSFGYQATVDGGPSNQCGALGGTSHGIYGPVAGVYDTNMCIGGSTGPHLYYQDQSTGALREAFWY